MAGEWRDCEWGDIAELAYGKALRGYQDAEGDYRVYGTNGPIGWHEEPLCTHPGVIVGRKGAYRGIHYCTEPFYVIDTAFYLEPKEDMDQRWAYYCLLTYDINSMDSGSAIPSTSRDAFYHLPVSVPPLDEQQAIACILGALDDKIELNRRMNQTLEGMAQAIFKSWFVDFDPVRAKAEGRQPPGLKPEIAALFPDSFDDSELGQVPKGWRVGTLADIAVLNPESWNKNTRPPVINYVDLSNTKWGRIENIATYEQNDAPSRAQRVLRPKDTIVGTVRPGNGSYSLINEEGLTGSTGFAVLRPQEPEYEELIYLAATAPPNIERLSNLADGAAYPAVRPNIVADTYVVLPGSELVNTFSTIVGLLLNKIAQNEKESRTLSGLRDTLLPKLVSGDLPVPDAERIVGRCV
ncbi:MAG: restriction endonuclease subunit S [Deltaproteobacteria bacterium]|nr:restriction endonuclease subunit S [Deltaproteobacteria bacterium]